MNDKTPASRLAYERFIKGDSDQEQRLGEARDRLKLADQLRALREALGLSLATLAERSETDVETIGRLEAGEFDADTYAALDRVATALGAEIHISLESPRAA